MRRHPEDFPQGGLTSSSRMVSYGMNNATREILSVLTVGLLIFVIFLVCLWNGAYVGAVLALFAGMFLNR